MKFDTYQDVTNAIIAKIEDGVMPWRAEWSGGPMLAPKRVTGEEYRGINVVLLWMRAAEAGFSNPSWMTFKQAKTLGAQVRKGEKATRIVFYKTLKIEGGEGEDDRNIPMLRTYSVFNADQIDGLPEKFAHTPATPTPAANRDAAKERALLSCGADVREGGNRAFYSPSSDTVQMPEFHLFENATGYLATLAHELCHWTGHKTRLDRKQTGSHKSQSYAFEELIAELGAAFVGARLGIAGEHFENHAAYLGSWAKALKDDKRAIFRAASAAQAAADMVLADAGEIATHAAAESLAAPAPAIPAKTAKPQLQLI